MYDTNENAHGLYSQEVFRQLFTEQLRTWPELGMEDLLKALYQCVFGCRHLNIPFASTALQNELALISSDDCESDIEPLGRCFCRVPLSSLKAIGLSTETFARILALSAKMPTGSQQDLETGLRVLLEMAAEHAFPFSWKDAADTAAQWRASGFDAPHHSAALKTAHPIHYRVIHRNFLWIFPLLAQIDQLMQRQGRAIAAIDGGSASGKTTLGALLAQIYDCNVFHMDDFFLQPFQRTPERLAQPGGNVDRERFLEEVLLPVCQGKPVHLRAYDCHSQSMRPAVTVPWKPLTIVEGAYSMHPALTPHYDLSALISIRPEQQRERLKKRNTPEEQAMFLNRWIPMEQHYFEATDVRNRCDIILEVEP